MSENKEYVSQVLDNGAIHISEEVMQHIDNVPVLILLQFCLMQNSSHLACIREKAFSLHSNIAFGK